MGASNSVPLWMNPEGATPAGYDQWGSIGTMQQPPQYDWSELHTEGTPDTSMFPPQYISGKKASAGTTVPFVGQLNDRLSTWGANQFAVVPNVLNGFADPVEQFPFIEDPSSSGRAAWRPGATTCTPKNFPNCDMTDFAAANTPLTQYAGWWSTVGLKTLVHTKPLNAAQIYADAIERSVASYSNGSYQGLEDLNSSDTSGYDPCAGQSTLERVIPLLLGTAGVVLIRVYGAEIFAFLPSTSKGYLEATTFGTLFFLGQAVVLQGSVFEKGLQPVKDAVVEASAVLSVGAGLTLSGVIAQQAAFSNISPTYVTMGSAGIGWLLRGVAVRPLGALVVSSSPLLFLPMLITHWVAKLFCYFSSAGSNACDDFGSDAGGTAQGFADVRRWDVASLSARLTDIACDDLGIPRDHPRAQFIMRSLMTNPGWMEAATVGGNNSLYETKNVNPLGLVAQIEETGSTTAAGAPMTWSQAWTDDRFTFTGDPDVTGLKAVTAQNLFGCQNFDILYNASPYCWNGTVGKQPEGSNLPQCAKVTVDTGEDSALTTNMRTWLKAAVDASLNPINLINQFKVRGLAPKNVTNPQTLPPVADFLKNAHRDSTTVPGIGFDDVGDRGAFAALYLNISHPIATGVEATECLANSYFALPSMQAAWEYVLAKWDLQDQIAYAHFLYRDDDLEMGESQVQSFVAWEAGFVGVKDFKKKHPFPEPFTGAPSQPVPGPITLQPPKGAHIYPISPFDDGSTYVNNLTHAFFAAQNAGDVSPLLEFFDVSASATSWDPALPATNGWATVNMFTANMFYELTMASFMDRSWMTETASTVFVRGLAYDTASPFLINVGATWFPWLCTTYLNTGETSVFTPFFLAADPNAMAGLRTWCPK